MSYSPIGKTSQATSASDGTETPSGRVAFDLTKTRTNSKRAKRSPPRTGLRSFSLQSVFSFPQSARARRASPCDSASGNTDLLGSREVRTETLSHKARSKLCRVGVSLRHPLKAWRLRKRQRLIAKTRLEQDAEHMQAIPTSRPPRRLSDTQIACVAEHLQARRDLRRSQEVFEARPDLLGSRTHARRSDLSAWISASDTTQHICKNCRVSGLEATRSQWQQMWEEALMPLAREDALGFDTSEPTYASSSNTSDDGSYGDPGTAATSCHESSQDLGTVDFLQLPTAEPSRVSSSNNLFRFSRVLRSIYHSSSESLNSVYDHWRRASGKQSATSLVRTPSNNAAALRQQYHKQLFDRTLHQLEQHQCRQQEQSDDSDLGCTTPATSRARQQAARERQSEEDRTAALITRLETLQAGRTHFYQQDWSKEEREENRFLACIDPTMQEHIETMRQQRKQQVVDETGPLGSELGVSR